MHMLYDLCTVSPISKDSSRAIVVRVILKLCEIERLHTLLYSLAIKANTTIGHLIMILAIAAAYLLLVILPANRSRHNNGAEDRG